MEKIKKYKDPKNKNERIGIPTGLMDKFGNEILTGDSVQIVDCLKDKRNYQGIVLWHRGLKEFGLFMGCWYLDRDPYKYECYGKYIRIPKDNGMRMNLKII